MDVLCEYTAAQEFMSGVEHLNGLLHYALTHPPPNLTVVLPKGFDCVEELDVSICPIPVRQYRKAAANPEKEYIYDIGRRLSFLGGRAGSLPASRRREASWSWGSPSHGITVGADAFDEQVHPGTAAPPPREGGAKGLAQRGKHLISSLFSVRGAGSVAEAPTMSVAGPSRPLTPRRLDSGAGNSLLDEGRSLLSLFGAETFSMADHWANTLGGRSTVMDEAPTRFAPTPPAYAADLCSVFQPQLCQTFGGSFFLFVYEHLLLSAAWSNPADMTVALGIIKSIYRPLFGVEDQQHNRSLQCLAPLLTEVHVSCEAALDVREVAGTVLDSQPHAAPPCVAFRARMEALVAASTSAHHDDGQPDGEAAGRYPLAIRAALVAGALVPVHRADLRENLAAMEGVRRCVNAMQRLLDVPAEVADYCHVHAQLLALDDSGVDMSAQCANLAHLTELVHGLGGHQDEENLPLTPERKYRYFVLQEVLSIAITPIPWVHTYNSTMVPRCVLALAIETCLSLQPSFLSLNILVNGRPLMSVRHSSGVFVLLLLSVLFTSSFLQECPTICPEVGDGCDGTCAKRRTTKSETVPSFEASLDGLAERIISSNQMAICRVLSGTIPVAQALLLPVFLQMGVFMLGKHWARSLTNMDLQHATQDEERGGSGARASAEMQIPIQLPEDFEASLNTLATYLGATLPPSSRGPASSESPPPNEEVLTALAMHASRSLAPLHHYVSRYDRQRRWELEAAVEELERQHHAVGWAADGAHHQDVRIPRKDLSEAAMRCFGRPFAPALVSDPRGVHQARLAFYGVVMRRFIALVEVPQEVMQSARASATKAGNTILSSSPPPSSPTRPTLALQLRALVGLAATIHSSSTKGKGLTCQALLHRCNTLLELRQIHDNFMRAVAEQHSLVGAITGRPDDGSAAEQLRTTIAMADSAAVEEQLCQLLAIATLLESKVFALIAPHVGFRGSASERRQLRQLVGTCTTSAGHHQTSSDTSFSVSTTLAQLYRLLNCQVMPLLHDAKMVQQVREWAGMYFVELLYGVLVEGDGKWPNAASSITGADFDLITNFFTSQAATTFATPSVDDAVDDLAVFGDRIVLEEGLNEHISPGEAMARRLAELRWIHGQVGRLSAAQLKEALAGSSTMRPCWRFIIEAVLEHHPK